MKKITLLAILLTTFISCSKDDSLTETNYATVKKDEVFDFPSYSVMDEKIDEISEIKAQMDKSTSLKYIQYSNNDDNENNFEYAVLKDLKNYHNDRLKDIYTLRKKINFTSIQSIADEINSLELINPSKSDDLFKEYGKFLIKENKYEVKTIFENRTAEVINSKGQLFIKGNVEDFKIKDSNNKTGRYIQDEYIKTGIAAYSTDSYFKIEYYAGREKHKDDFGKTFFRYYTEFKSYRLDLTTGIYVPCPAQFEVESTSIAGFSQTGSMPFSDFAFTMQYPSGIGYTLRNTGGQNWTAYQPEGGYIKGYFLSKMAGFFKGASCDFNYTR